MTARTYFGVGELLDKSFPNRDWSDHCEATRYQITRLTNDIPVGRMQAFDSAKDALNASKIVGRSRASAEAGQVGWWDKTAYGHDMISLGNDLWIGATGLGDTVRNLGGGLKVLHGSSYPANFIGFADKVGSNPRALILPWRKKPTSKPGTVSKPAAKKHVITHPIKGEDWDFAPPSKAIQLRIQRAMMKRGRYWGKNNGVWGNLSVAGIQRTVRGVASAEYNYHRDLGVPSHSLCVYIQLYAEKYGKFKGLKKGGHARRGYLGPNAWLAFARGLEAGLK